MAGLYPAIHEASDEFVEKVVPLRFLLSLGFAAVTDGPKHRKDREVIDLVGRHQRLRDRVAEQFRGTGLRARVVLWRSHAKPPALDRFSFC
jgi:hypothetical protein